jgi:hypothetical protein
MTHFFWRPDKSRKYNEKPYWFGTIFTYATEDNGTAFNLEQRGVSPVSRQLEGIFRGGDGAQQPQFNVADKTKLLEIFNRGLFICKSDLEQMDVLAVLLWDERTDWIEYTSSSEHNEPEKPYITHIDYFTHSYFV